jgi:hypothetical protein
MRGVRGGFVVAGLLAAVAVALPARAAPARTIDYLYIEANEAGGSGGHAAIRFGDRVFHFQWTESGLLGVSREDFAGFRRNYALLENRTIRVLRIPVSEETFDLVHGHFARRRLIQHQHVRILESLSADRRLLQTFQAVRRGTPAAPVAVEGAGYFHGGDPSREDIGTPSTAIEDLRERIAATHGPDFLGERLAEVQRQMAALDPARIAPPDTDVSMQSAPPAVYGLAQRYGDAAAAGQALEVIRTGRRLLPGSYLGAGPARVALGESDALAVDAMREALTESLVRLARSDRPDWGPALLVGLARLEALDQTRRAGAWVFLDVFPSDAPRVSHRRLARRPDLLTAVLRDARADFDTARARLLGRHAAGDGFRELDFAELEAAGNRLLEALGAEHDGQGLRLTQGRQAPARSAPLTGVVVPPRAAETVDDQVSLTLAREADYAARLQRLYGYQLVTRNCVTEIFREIDRALAGRGQGAEADRAARAESRQRLGGHLEMRGLRFIPAVSAAEAAATYTIAETLDIPSHRRASLDRLARDESRLRVFLRESNTLTSTLYDRHPGDSYFLFFTDDTVATRPLFGAANLLTGLGAAVAGVAALPFDRGAILWSGLKGIVFSLPELVFVNIRKGSFAYVGDDGRLQ